MSFVKTFNHPLHMVNYMRKLIVSSLATYEPKLIMKKLIPELNKELRYYFIFETRPHLPSGSMLYALCCFAEDGEILFSVRSSMPVSLWRYRRQGVAKTATMIEGVIRQHFKRQNVPLNRETPYFKADDGLYLANICWYTYKQLQS
jgi:hypothetical protein